MKKTPLLTIILLGFAAVLAGQVSLQSSFGDVTVKKSSSAKWEKATARMTFAPGDTIRTGLRSGAMIMVRNEESVISLSASSKLMITETMAVNKKKAPGFLLFLGALKSRIKKNADESMDFSTPTAVVGVRGTEFLIAVADDGTSKVGVTRGTVQVDGERNGVSLSSNESSTVALAGDPQDKVLFQGEIRNLENWMQTASSRIKGNEPAILERCSTALELNYTRIDELDRQKKDNEKRIQELKDERRQLLSAGDTNAARTKGQEAASLVTETTRVIIAQNNLDRRNQAVFEITERVYAPVTSDAGLKKRFLEIKSRFDLYHSKFVLTRKKGCL
jgi:hypothetical protein